MDDFANALSALGVAPFAPAAPSNNPGNLRPQGASNGFQSFATPEAGLAAMDDNLKAYGSKGINTISGVISRWAPPSENNTPAYISDVSKRLGIDPNAQIDLGNPIVRHALTTAITLHENGPKILTQPGRNAAPPPAQAQAAPVDNDFSRALDALNTTIPASSPAAPAAPPPSQGTAGGYAPAKGAPAWDPAKGAPPITDPSMDLTAHLVSGAVAPVVAGYSGLVRGAGALIGGKSLSEAAGIGADTANSVRDALTYQPRTEQGATMANQFDTSNYNPLNWIPRATSYLGEKGGDALAANGMPAAGALVQGVGAAAPAAMGLGAKSLSGMLKGGAEVAERIDPTMEPPPAPKPRYKMGADGKPVLIEQGPPPQTVAPVTPSGQPPAGIPLSQVGKAPPAAAPAATPVPSSPQAVQTMAQNAPAQLFPETKTIAGGPGVKFSPEEQANRARILQSVGIDPDSMRISSLTGDAIGGSTDFQASRPDTIAGRVMKTQLENERNALVDHSGQLVKDTGGTIGTDQSNMYARGNTILAPMDAMKDWFDNKITGLYKVADQRAQGVPTQLAQFKDVLGDASEKTNSDRVLLPDAVTAYAKKLGMVGEDGSISGTAQQAETLRKYLNEKWSPNNSGFVGKLKDAIDNDVMSAAGEDIYGQARALREQRANTLDDPKGIAQLMDSSGPQGINRAVPVEKIPDKITGLSVDQFSHIVNTLKNAPPELQPQAAASLAEIKAQFANKVKDIGSNQNGQWNAKGVTNYLQANAARMAQVFQPEEIARFRNLNDAGHILAKDQSYPGAAIQAHNLATQGLVHGLPVAGASVGAAIGGPLGSAVGAVAGRAASNAIGNAAEVRAVKGRMVKLSDLPGNR